MYKVKVGLLGSAFLLGSSLALAAVPPEQAAKLGDSLTPIGAEKAGNAAGTIPAWDGGLASSNDRYSNPFSAEAPLFTITAANAEQYKANLTPGQLAMLKRYPDTFSIPVYPTHRTAALPDTVYSAAKENAVNATLTDDGNGLQNFSTAVPFPIPADGLEVIWNHMTRYRGGALERTFVQVPVQANGNYTAVKINEKMSWPSSLKGGADPKKIRTFCSTLCSR